MFLNINDLNSSLAAKKPNKVILLTSVLVLIILNLCIFFVNADSPINYSDYTITIDAGHGGKDPGKVSSDNVSEKDINLEIAIKLQAVLSDNGFNVIMTRTTDESPAISQNLQESKTNDLVARVNICNNSNSDYFISIHQNSYPDATCKGAQVFYHSSSEASKSLATSIQKHLISDVDPTNKRQIKAGNDYYVLHKSSCPAIIIECGFLSSPEEVANLSDSNYQEAIALAIMNGIIEDIEN